MLTYVATSRESSHEYRVETTGASHRGIRDSRIILPRFDLGAMLNDTAEKGERRETGPNDGDKVAGRRGTSVTSWGRCFDRSKGYIFQT